MQHHEGKSLACSPTPFGDDKDRFDGDGVANHLSYLGAMPTAFSPIWAAELDITKSLLRATHLTVAAPMFTRSLKHARSTPDDDGVGTDAGRKTTQFRAKRMQETLTYELEPVPTAMSHVPSVCVRFALDFMMWHPSGL